MSKDVKSLPQKGTGGEGKSQVILISFLKNKGKPLVCFKALFCLNCSDRAPLKCSAACKRIGSVGEEEGGGNVTLTMKISFMYLEGIS